MEKNQQILFTICVQPNLMIDWDYFIRIAVRMHLVCFPSFFCGLGQSTSRALCGFFKGSHPVTNRWYSPDCHVDLHAKFNQFDKGFHWLRSCVCN